MKVNVQLWLKDIAFTPDGLKFVGDADQFNNRVYDTEEEIRAKIIIPITEKLGNRWGTIFIEEPTRQFLVDVFCDTEDDYIFIVNKIMQNVPELDFDCFFRKKYETFPHQSAQQ